MKIQRVFKAALLASVVLLGACKKDSNDDPKPDDFRPIPITEESGKTSYIFTGMEASTGTDVLVPVGSLTEGNISPVGNGKEQPAWMTYVSAGKTLVISGYASDNVLTGYKMDNGQFTTVGSMITELQTYVYGLADENTLLAFGVTRAGYEERVIYKINLTDMSIISRTATRIDERKADGLVAWPTSLTVRGDKLFVSYYLMGSGQDSVKAFATPNSDQARVAVYSYPDITFEKIITDDRTADIGCYASVNAVMSDETGNLYTFSPASYASGYTPVPTKPSGFLKINSGSTEFDKDYFFNFEGKAGGKINNAIYVGNGKVLVRFSKDDSVLWGTYAPNTATPICYIGIADMNAQSFTEISSIPAHGGEWGMANLIRNGKVYVNISDATQANVYEIDPQTATAVKGAQIEGNWVKGFHQFSE